MAATLPEQVFHNNMVHHPLLQYQMLFPGLLMSLAPSYEDEDPMKGAGGNVNDVDYLKFSALANQLAITQINQVIMDLVMETPGDDLKKMMEIQKSFIGLVKRGFSHMNQGLRESKALVDSSSQIISKQGNTMISLQENLSKTVDLQEASKQIATQTASDVKVFQKIMKLIGDSILKIQYTVDNITADSLCCNNSMFLPEMTRMGITPPTEAPLLTNDILQGIQGELSNLTRTLIDFITISQEASNDRTIIKELIGKCANSSLREVDLSNITQKIEEDINANLGLIQPQIQNISEHLRNVDSAVLATQNNLKDIHDVISSNLTRNDNELQNLGQLTQKYFTELTSKIDNLFKEKENDCPEQFFPVGEECFFLTTDDPTTFDEAIKQCEVLDSRLAEPPSLHKFLAIMDDLDYNKTMGVWMGGKKVEKHRDRTGEVEGFTDYIWLWMNSGSEIEHGWNQLHPLAGGNCIILYNLGFESSDCEKNRGFVCQHFT